MKRAFVTLAPVAFAACATLLGIRPPEGGPFEHRAHVLNGIACLDCHTSILSATSSSAVALPTRDLCWKCHEDPHDKKPCLACHGDRDTARRTEMARYYLDFDHSTHTPRLDGQCVRCHVDVREERASLMPKMGVCLSCHAHEDDFEVRDCDRCHVALEAETVRPSSHAVHADDFVRSHGPQASSSADLCRTCHTERECASCHGINVPALPWRFELENPRRAGLHRANFVARHATEARVDASACLSCHTRETCQSCHAREDVATGSTKVSPHPPGWVGVNSNRHGIEARRDPLACASCHGGAGEMLCVDCHAVGRFGGSPHPPGYRSAKNRARDVPCRWCHVP
ncbi:MAG: cytochrome c3 family protein [Deltaproteobacteria bacterium]